MSEANELTAIFRDTEAEFIRYFCETYKNEMQTPDGFSVFCKYPEDTAKHFCRGTSGVFQRTRAQRMGWVKYILFNPSERNVLIDTNTKKILFFFTRRRKPHLIVCEKLDGKLNLISGFPVRGERAERYRNGDPPYVFYRPE